ncbi:Protein IVY1 [Colletotrichum tanaceti]|uniref:Protein IVY1 n=1 Tax=Colletotrichum tanaceti TaxID=1306861 RepID=A0A4U6XGV6_9PEZI|nr:Protein IVY1 [Colletotrichum tanaceti]TKW53247.1 Protein IVY1 [Colletotrichum tanaceti]
MASPTTPGDDRPSSPTPSQLPPVPGSPVYSLASTANPLSSYHLPLPPPPRPVHAVLTKSDLELSQTAYSDLIHTAKSYRLALASLSTAASSFGSALESCARLKEARAESLSSASQPSAVLSASFTAGAKGSCTADLLLSASGVHHLVANHQQILSETVYRDFEVPLLHELDKWRQRVDDEEEAYVREVKARNLEIRRLEKEGLKLHKQRRRDVGKFRAHLVDLTTRLDGLTSLHGDHARTLLRESQDTSGRIVEVSCSLVRAEVDIFESLARKGWSGGGLDELLERGADLFASDEVGDHHHSGVVGGGTAEAAKLFSILPPKSILADAASDVTRHGGGGGGGGGHKRGDSLLSDPDRYQSLTAAAAAASPGLGDDNDADSIFSETNFNRPRGVRPFSPQPIRRHATDVTFDSLGVGLSAESRVVDRVEEEVLVEKSRHDVLREEEHEGEGEGKGEGESLVAGEASAQLSSPWADEEQTEEADNKQTLGEEDDEKDQGASHPAVEDADEEEGKIANETADRGRQPGRRWSVKEEDDA